MGPALRWLVSTMAVLAAVLPSFALRFPEIDPLLAWRFEGTPPAVSNEGSAPVRLTATALDPTEGPDGPAARFGAPGSLVASDATPAIAFDSTESFAFELWLRTEQRQFATILMAKDRPGGTVSYSLVLNRASGRLSFELWSWARVRLPSRSIVNDGRWHRVIGAYDAATGEAALLVDGTLECVAPTGAGGPETVALRVGNNIDTDQPYRGDLAGLAIVDRVPEEVARAMTLAREERVLAADEVQSMYTAYFERLAAPRPWRPTDRAAWEERCRTVRRKVLEDLGLSPLPERCPLDVRHGGKLEREGYTVERIYWQAWPGYYAAGTLYMPDNGVLFPRPAVLNPHGHWENGNRHPFVQARLIALAKKGFICLAPDTLHFTDWSLGICPQTIMTWSNIRALDLLCAMPEVDASRIGCTGCSGGAQQTFYLMPTEDRIHVAVPVCMVSKFRTILSIDDVHCSCNHVPGIAADTDTPEMAAAFAPRDALIITVTGDWTKTYPAEDHPSVQAAYALFDAEDRVHSTHYESGHDYNQAMREEMYGVMLRALGVEGDALEPAHEAESLETLATLDAVPAEHEGTDAIVREFRGRRVPSAPTLSSAREAEAWSEALREAIRRCTRLGEIPAAVTAESRGSVTIAGRTVEKLAISTEPEIRVPALLVAAPGGSGVTVLVDAAGARAALEGETVARLRAEGQSVLLVDPRYLGEWADGLNWPSARSAALLNGVILGQAPGTCGLFDVLCAARYARARGEGPVRVVGVGDAGVLALLAAALDPEIAGVEAVDLGPTFLAGREGPCLPHILSVGDLPDFAAAVAPRPVRIAGVADPAAYARTRAAYAAFDTVSALAIEQ